MPVALPPLSKLEVEILNGLDPVLRPMALQHRANAIAAGLPFTFLSGRRSRSEQQAEVERDGRTTPAAPAGKSKHEVGAAYDIVRVGVSGDQLSRIGVLAEQLGLKWGGRFRDAKGAPAPDPNHFELPQTRGEILGYQTLQLIGLGALVGVVVLVVAGE